MRRLTTVITAIVLLAFTQCGSDDTPEPETSAQEPQTEEGQFRVPGSSAQIEWIRELTESLKAAKLAHDLQDTTGAIWTAESLLVVAQATMDTLPPQDQMARFIMVFTSDVYGSLRKWYITAGQNEAAQELSDRYEGLALRMQQRRDSVATQVP